MKKGLVLALVLMAGFVSAQDPKPATSPSGAPRISIEPASFDFGQALQNKTLIKEFSLKNFGGTDLVIEGVSTTCGCTVGQLETKVIKPGATVPLRVSLETRNYSGVVQRAVLVRSNDPAKALFEVRVQANVQPAK